MSIFWTPSSSWLIWRGCLVRAKYLTELFLLTLCFVWVVLGSLCIFAVQSFWRCQKRKKSKWGKSSTDQGRDYECELFKQPLGLLDVGKLRTTAYHPKCDGPSDRYKDGQIPDTYNLIHKLQLLFKYKCFLYRFKRDGKTDKLHVRSHQDL